MTEATVGELKLSAARPEYTAELLDPGDPFDRLVIDFKAGADNDTLPTQAEQRMLISILQQENGTSDGLMEQTHQGFIAAVAYPFKPHVEHDELMLNGTRAFLAATKTYALEGDDIFYDYAIVAMRRLLSGAYPEVPVDHGELYSEQPMESLMHFVSGLESMDSPEQVAAIRRDQARQKLETAGLTPNEWKILPVLHLYDEEAESSEDIGLSSGLISRHAHNARGKLGLDTREDLALLAMEAGILTDIKIPEHMNRLTIRQRMVSMHLDKSKARIADNLGLSVEQVTRDIAALYKVTGARSRIELFLVAHTYNFEPTYEDIAIHAHPALKEFTEFQRPILARVHLTNARIASQLPRSETSIKSAVSGVIKAMGFSGRTARTALVLELYKRGFSFDIRKPLMTLAEILSARELQAGHMLELSNDQIAATIKPSEPHTVNIDTLIHKMKVKTGARTRAELALQILTYDTGESRPEHTNELSLEERFFRALGIEPVPMEQTRPWLDYATPRQAEYLEVFHYSEGEISIEALAKRFGVARATVALTMKRGLKNIREGLEEERRSEI